jgi:DNA segregation ATPase FtsK/SpoIIIE, S-DNA-T family
MKKKVPKESGIKKSRNREVIGILFIFFSVFLILSLVTHDKGDWPGSSREFGEPTQNFTGRSGAYISHVFFENVGYTSFAFSIFLLVTGIVFFLHKGLKYLIKPAIFLSVFGLFIPLLVSLTLSIGSDTTIPDSAHSYGGMIGVFLENTMVTYLGRIGAFLISLSAILVTLVITTNLKPSTMVEYIVYAAKFVFNSLAAVMSKPGTVKKTAAHKKTQKAVLKTGDIDSMAVPDVKENPFLTPVEEEPAIDKPDLPGAEPEIRYRPRQDRVDSEEEYGQTEDDTPDSAFESQEETVPQEYVLPTIDLLDELQPDIMPESREDMIKKSQRLVENLQHFNINTEVRQITPGPIVTRYELTLAPGIKVGRVVSLSDDLAMALKAKGGIRILAPIPGKAAIGIEVPNDKRSTVYFREIVESETFQSTDQPLVLALGKNTAGEPVIADLEKMPHLLIAGSTGAGKSVSISTIIASILMKSSPDRVRMILIDPKVVELSVYNSIPHLLTPVITDPQKASDALKWAVREMETRYRQLATLGVRNIVQYNAKIAELKEVDAQSENADIPNSLPFIVIIIDEFADLMLISSNEIEEYIARLAQMARAVGIHLVIATQRPSADIITGLIKANFPSRIAFKVMQAANSRIILDQGGADKLLGLGDMLFLQVGKPEPIRLHGAYISNDECLRLVDFASTQPTKGLTTVTDEMFREEIEEDDNMLGLRDPNTKDILFYKASRLVVRNNQGSVSLLQRRLKIGYARAARLIDQLELAGIVSPYDGSKAREVLVDDRYIDELEAGEI